MTAAGIALGWIGRPGTEPLLWRDLLDRTAPPRLWSVLAQGALLREDTAPYVFATRIRALPRFLRRDGGMPDRMIASIQRLADDTGAQSQGPLGLQTALRVAVEHGLWTPPIGLLAWATRVRGERQAPAVRRLLSLVAGDVGPRPPVLPYLPRLCRAVWRPDPDRVTPAWVARVRRIT